MASILQSSPNSDNPQTITAGALIKRINRSLANDFEQLRVSRSESVARDVGRYFIVDLYRNAIISQRIDLEELGRELRVLRSNERVEPH